MAVSSFRSLSFIAVVVPVLLAVAPSALAQSNPSGDTLLDGSIEQATISQAAVRNAQIFGAAGFLDRVLLPTAARSDGAVVISAESSVLQGMLRAPANLSAACGLVTDAASCPYGLLDIDTFSSAGGIAFQDETFGLFYVSSVTSMRLTEGGTEVMYPFVAGALAGLGFFNLYTAPLYTGPTKLMDEGMGSLFEYSSQDYIVGGTAQVPVAGMRLGARAGLVATQAKSGAYVSVTEGVLDFVISAVLRPDENEVPYAMVGLQRSPWLGRLLMAGSTRPSAEAATASLYARSLHLEPITAPEGASTTTESMWTVHAAAENIYAGDELWAEMSFAAGVRPTPFFHEARGSVYWGAPDDHTGLRFSAGLVGMPAMHYYGTDGGQTFAWAAEAELEWIRLALRRNDTEMLMRFPYAQGATQMYIGFDLGQWW